MTNFEVGYTPTNLRIAIEKLGVTQLKAAEMCGVKERTLRQWLNEDLESKSHAAQWRNWHGHCMAWLFNPWTGTRRESGSVGMDTTGILIQPPDEPLYAE